MNKVQHFEFPADDMDRAKKFYQKVFGWSFEDYPMPGMEYSAIYATEVDEKTHRPKEAGSINGGLLKRGGPWTLKTPTVAVVVPDLKKAIQKIKTAGGSVLMEPTKVGDMGLYSYIQDTEGNTIGVWQNLTAPEPKKAPKKKESVTPPKFQAGEIYGAPARDYLSERDPYQPTWRALRFVAAFPKRDPIVEN